MRQHAGMGGALEAVLLVLVLGRTPSGFLGAL